MVHAVLLVGHAVVYLDVPVVRPVVVLPADLVPLAACKVVHPLVVAVEGLLRHLGLNSLLAIYHYFSGLDVPLDIGHLVLEMTIRNLLIHAMAQTTTSVSAVSSYAMRIRRIQCLSAPTE